MILRTAKSKLTTLRTALGLHKGVSLVALVIVVGLGLSLGYSAKRQGWLPGTQHTASAIRPAKSQTLKVAASPSPTSSPKSSPTPAKSNIAVLQPKIGSSAANLPRQNYGIAAGGGLADIGTADLNNMFQGMRKLGVTWVRFDVDWSRIQPDSAASYDWANYDRIVSAVRANGMQGLGIIDYTPTWAQRGDCRGSNKCSPASASDYANFTGAVASRYGPQGIHAWEIWNEPNSSEFWLPAANTADYTALLKQSYHAIKSADASAFVLTGGTASTGTGNNNFSSADFVAGIYANGGRGYFDAVADHPYAIPFLPSFNWYWNTWQQMANTQPSIRGVMVANGDAAKKVWITEYGSPTGGSGGQASNGQSMAEQNDDHVTEALQAEIVTNAIALYRSYSWAGNFFWYSYKDNGTDPSYNENFFGLIRADGSFKPAYYSFARSISL